jgi:stearoyl-CoA desaturase (delta-9 desaturase)
LDSPAPYALPSSTEAENILPKRKYRWPSIVFIVVVTVATLVFCPIYLWRHGLTNAETAFFLFYTLASSFSINLGYHRLFSHAAFKAAWPVRLLVLFFGGAAFEKSAMAWAALHRLHHRYTDTDRDPYNIKRGFFYAHVGWVLVEGRRYDYSNVRDLARDALVVHQDRHYKLWAHLSGLVIPLLIGAWIGGWTYAILFPVAARIFIVMNSVFCINSISHTFGSQTYDPKSSARDHWLGVLLTNGDGFHNYHHRFPRDYRHGFRWYHWDPIKWLIWIFSCVGLTSELNKTPAESIRRAEGRD